MRVFGIMRDERVFPVTKQVFPVGLKVCLRLTISKQAISSGPRSVSSPYTIDRESFVSSANLYKRFWRFESDFAL